MEGGRLSAAFLFLPICTYLVCTGNRREERLFMKALGLNPYLPSWEFVPDGEPHVFDGRIYLYGSHDSRNGVSFCEGDYVVWSAPVDDPGNWRCEGVSYRKDQDPLNGASYEGKLPVIDMPLGTPENPHANGSIRDLVKRIMEGTMEPALELISSIRGLAAFAANFLIDECRFVRSI